MDRDKELPAERALTDRRISRGVALRLFGAGATAAALGPASRLSPSNPAVADAAPSVTLDLWIPWTATAGNGDLWVAAANHIAQAFTAAHPNISVKVLPGATSSDVKLLTAIAGGKPPDVAIIDTPADFAPRGALQSLTPLIQASHFDTSRFFPAQLAEGQWNGAQYALPAMENEAGLALSWNKALFQKAGLDPAKPPTTLDELRAFSDKLTTKDKAGNLVTLGFDPLDAMGVSIAFWARMFGGDTFNASTGKFTLNADPVAKAAEYVVGFYKAYGPTNFASFHKMNGTWSGSIASGRTAMLLNGDWQPGELVNLKFTQPIGYTWAPTINGKHVQDVGGWLATIPKGASNPDAAWRFIQYLTSDAGANTCFKYAGGLCLTRTSIKTLNTSRYPGLSWYLKSVATADKVYVHPDTFAGYSLTYNLWTNGIQAVALGKTTVPAMLNDMQRRCQQAYDLTMHG